MRYLCIALLAIVGCTQAETKTRVVTQEEFGKALGEALDRLERMERRVEEQFKVQAEDREEIVKYNACQADCESRYPWPDRPEGIETKEQESAWWQETMPVRKNRAECNDSCNKIKPKAQVDWSC